MLLFSLLLIHLSISFRSLLPLQQKPQKSCLSSLPPIPFLLIHFTPTPVGFLSLHATEPGLTKALNLTYSYCSTAVSFPWLPQHSFYVFLLPHWWLLLRSLLPGLFGWRLSPELELFSPFTSHPWWSPPVPWLYHLCPVTSRRAAPGSSSLHFTLRYPTAHLISSFIEPPISIPPNLLHPKPSPSHSMASLSFQLLR